MMAWIVDIYHAGFPFPNLFDVNIHEIILELFKYFWRYFLDTLSKRTFYECHGVSYHQSLDSLLTKMAQANNNKK